MKALISVEISEEGLPVQMKKSILIDELYNKCYEWTHDDVPPKILFVYEESDEKVDEDLDGLIE